jgi:hypothetical protein
MSGLAAQLIRFAKPNLAFILSSVALGAAAEACTRVPLPKSRFPHAISTNNQLVLALSALEDVLPDARIMTALVRRCEMLCQLEFNTYGGAQYLATSMVGQIQTEVEAFRTIPWLSDDLPELEHDVMEAVRAVQTNISVNFK